MWGGNAPPHTPLPINNWDPNTIETIPMNQEDYLAPQPKISHMETNHNNSIVVVPV
jgi:hypothetical protein